jgi:vacuolar-type H+-ATPase subunit H
LRSQLPKDIESQSPQEAINRVLEAERAMIGTLDDCRQRANRIIEEARIRARSIARRTDRRIRLLHQRCDMASDATVKAIESSFDDTAGDNPMDFVDDDYLKTVAERLAQELTTAEQDASGTCFCLRPGAGTGSTWSQTRRSNVASAGGRR